MLTTTIQTSRQQAGVSMVEILVTVVIISIGLLGIAALHTLSLRNNYEALGRSQAAVLAQDISDRMRANYNIAKLSSNDYVVTKGAVSLPSTPTLAQYDLFFWKQSILAKLPRGDGAIDYNAATKIFTISIYWTERSSSSTVSYITQVEI